MFVDLLIVDALLTRDIISILDRHWMLAGQAVKATKICAFFIFMLIVLHLPPTLFCTI